MAAGEPFRALRTGEQGEEAAVGRVDVEPDAVALPEGEGVVDRIDGPEAGGAGGEDDRAHLARPQDVLECVEADAAAVVGRDRIPLHAQDVAHAAVGVVGVGAVGDAAAGVELAGDEEGLQVGDRAAGGEVAEVGVVAEHRGQLRDGLAFHAGGGGTAVQGVVVGVDQHGGEVADDRRGVWRLEHLPRVARVEEGIVVLQPPGELLEGGGEAVVVDEEGRVLLVGAERAGPPLYRVVGPAEPVLKVH